MAESPCVLQKSSPPSVGPAPLFIAVDGLVAKWAEISANSLDYGRPAIMARSRLHAG